MERIESCHSIWFFDSTSMRFCRLPRSAKAVRPPADAVWVPYYGLEIDLRSGAFLVALSEEQNRFLRSWRHDSVSCRHCGAGVGAEVVRRWSRAGHVAQAAHGDCGCNSADNDPSVRVW